MHTEHKPFIPDTTSVAELTLVPVLMGIVLGIIFGASSLYLALKVGMTVSASIPVAVLAITLFRAFTKVFGLRPTTILENNIVQTTGSAGESIAFGIAVTMPALLILGYNMELTRIMTVAVLGGLLGVLMMIPLRYALVVKSHGQLAFPEGTACAEVLIVGEKGGTSALTVFTGFFVGLFYKLLMVGAHLWNEIPRHAFAWFKGAGVSAEVSPELMGVGFIIGPRIASIMVAGGILATWALTPMIMLFGQGLDHPIFPATKLISEMTTHEIWRNYVLYIGAGAVATGGIISLYRSLPIIIRSAAAGLGTLKLKGASSGLSTKRTERDISMKYVLIGALVLVLAIWAMPALKLNVLGAILLVAFGFLFVTVSSRLTGEIGSSSNPISGMTVATLLLTCLIFVLLGWIGEGYRVTALSVAAIVCVAASNGGTTAQDLKTGFLVGATPRYQQLALLIGVLTSAVVIGFTLELLNNASTIYSKKDLPAVKVSNVSELTQMESVGGPEGIKDTNLYHVLQLAETPQEGPLVGLHAGKYLVDDAGTIQYLVDPGINGSLKARDDGTPVQKYDAPKAALMALIIDGILTQKLPWALVLLGVAISLVMELCGIASLPFAVGVYLPLSSSMPIFIGGAIRAIADRRLKKKAATTADDSSPGVLFSSGLIAGGAIAGIGMAILLVTEGWAEALDMSQWLPTLSSSNVTAWVAFGLMGLGLYLVATRKKKT